MYKVDLVYDELVKAKPTVNDSGFITYLNKIYVSGIGLYNSGCFITQWGEIVKNSLPHGLKTLGEQKYSPRLVKLVLKITYQQSNINKYHIEVIRHRYALKLLHVK